MPSKMKAPSVGTVQRIKPPGWKVLGSVPLFEGLSQRDLRRIAELAEEVWFPPGKIVIEEGRSPLAFYVILDGQARVVRGSRRKLLRRLGPGDYFGELSLIDGHPRSASIVADTTLDTIRLKRSAFRMMLRSEPDVALRIMEGMTALIRDLQHDAAE
jgi:CRP-like cAMP-binding protein